MIVGNENGFGLAILGVVIGLVINWIFSSKDAAILLGTISIIIADGIIRINSLEEKDLRTVISSPDCGGNLFFLPVWLFGILLICVEFFLE